MRHGGRQLLALTCLTLSVLVLASSAALAVWKVRHKETPSAAAPPADASREVRVSKPDDADKPNPPSPPAEMYGGIEIGSKGVKLVVVRLPDTARGGPALEMAAPPQTANTTLVAGLKESGILAPDALSDTMRVVAGFHERLRRDHYLPRERIYILASSGLFASLQDRPEQVEVNKRRLSAAVQQATGQAVVFLSEAQDLELTFRAAVPPAEAEDALLMDVSSGKTRVCYSEGALAHFVSLSFPFAAVPLAEEASQRVQERGGMLPECLADILANDERRQPWREGLQRNPGLVGLKRVYLTGGPAWALATITHPQERGRYVALTCADVEALARQLEKGRSGSIPEPKWMADKEDAALREVDAVMRNVRKAFNREQLLAGMKILLALAGDLGLKSAPDRQLRFARDGYLGPVLGYAMLFRNKSR